LGARSNGRLAPGRTARRGWPRRTGRRAARPALLLDRLAALCCWLAAGRLRGPCQLPAPKQTLVL
jgi:hypothetical protein